MLKIITILMTLTSALAFAGNGFEGRGASLTIELKGLSVSSAGLTATGVIKSSEFDSGLYFDPKNKNVELLVNESCRSLVELAFAQNFLLTVKGELQKFDEHFTVPNEVTFSDSKVLKCEVLRPKTK